MRLDPPDAKTSYDHVHLYDETGKSSLNQDLRVVKPNDKGAHIEYKGPKNPGGGSGTEDDGYIMDESGQLIPTDTNSMPIVPGIFGPPSIPSFEPIPVFAW